MAKFYIKDGDNRFLIEEKNHLAACQKAIAHWKSLDRTIGNKIYFSNKGFESMNSINCVNVKIITGLTYQCI